MALPPRLRAGRAERVLSAKDHAVAGAFAQALFGEGGLSLEGTVEKDFRVRFSALHQDDLARKSRGFKTTDFPDSWERVSIGALRITDTRGPNLAPFIARMRAGERLYAEAKAVKRDVLRVARDIRIELKLRSPVGNKQRYSYSRGRGPGGYRANHQIFLNGKPVQGAARRVPPGETAVAIVANRVDYAAVLETPQHYQVYQDVFNWAVARYGDEYDLSLRFLQAGLLGGSFVPAAGGRGALSYRHAKSNFPAIVIAPFGTLSRGAGKAFPGGKRRKWNRSEYADRSLPTVGDSNVRRRYSF